MAQDRISRLIATLMLCFLAGCGTVMRPSMPEQQPTADHFLLPNGGFIGSYTMDLSNGNVSLQQKISIPTTGFPAGTDPLGRFVWVAQEDGAEPGSPIIMAHPAVNTFARMPDGLFSASDQRDYQPRIYQITVEHDGKWAYDNQAQRIFSISPVDGHLEEAGRTTANDEFVVLHPKKNILYAANTINSFMPGQKTVFTAYASDNDTGQLNQMPNVSTEVQYQSREMAFTSDGNYLIVIDFELNLQMHLLAVDKDGGLREVDALTPESYPYGLVAHPKLPIMYHSSVLVNGIHSSPLESGLKSYWVRNGALTELPTIPVPGAVHILHISSNGRFLLVQSDQVYLITLNPQTGAASDIHPVSFSFP